MYEYGNARVRAMRARLIGRHVLEACVANYDADQMVSTLAQHDYGPDIALAMTRYSGAECVEEAARTNLTRTANAIRSFYSGSAGLLVNILLGRYDRHNITAALRGVATRASPEETARAWLPAGQIGEPLLRELASQPDLKRAVDLMASWRLPFAGDVSEALWRSGSESAGPLERALARAHYAAAFTGLPQRDHDAALIRELLAREVDVLNLSAVLRLNAQPHRQLGAEVAGEFMPGGARLAPSMLTTLCDLDDVGLAVARVATTPYGPPLDAALPLYRQTGRVSTLVRALDRHLTRWSLSQGRGDPLGIGIVIGYLAAKITEAVNLRLIARSIWLGVGRDAIFEQVWLPEA